MCQMCTGAHGGEKRALDPLELESQAVVSHPTWMLKTKLWCSAVAAAASTPHWGAVGVLGQLGPHRQTLSQEN